MQVADPAAGVSNGALGKLLTTAMQVQRLSPADAERHLPAKICGVVIYRGRCGPARPQDLFWETPENEVGASVTNLERAELISVFMVLFLSIWF